MPSRFQAAASGIGIGGNSLLMKFSPGKAALLTRAITKTTIHQDQVICRHTTVRQAGLWYIAQAAPPSQAADVDPIFKQMAHTLVFDKDAP